MNQDTVIEVEATVEFLPNKRYRASVWRTDEGNIFVRRSRKGKGGTGMVKVLEGENFAYSTTKDNLRLSVTIAKPTCITELTTQVVAAINAAILAADKNHLIDMIK